jgi:hypothetical protein
MDFPFFIVYDGKAVGFISYMTDLRCGMNSTAQTRKSFPPGFFFFSEVGCILPKLPIPSIYTGKQKSLFKGVMRFTEKKKSAWETFPMSSGSLSLVFLP